MRPISDVSRALRTRLRVLTLPGVLRLPAVLTPATAERTRFFLAGGELAAAEPTDPAPTLTTPALEYESAVGAERAIAAATQSGEQLAAALPNTRLVHVVVDVVAPRGWRRLLAHFAGAAGGARVFQLTFPGAVEVFDMGDLRDPREQREHREHREHRAPREARRERPARAPHAVRPSVPCAPRAPSVPARAAASDAPREGVPPRRRRRRRRRGAQAPVGTPPASKAA